MEFDGSQKKCTSCPKHMKCPIDSEFSFNNSGVEARREIEHYKFPRILKGYMAFNEDLLRGYHCKHAGCPGTIDCVFAGEKVDIEKCPGIRSVLQSGAVCADPLRTGVACGRCQEYYIALEYECVGCARLENFSLEVLGVLLVSGLAVVLALFTCSPLRGACGGCGTGCGDCNAALGCKGCGNSEGCMTCDSGMACCILLSPVWAACGKVCGVCKVSGSKLLMGIAKKKDELQCLVELLLPFAQVISFVNMLSIQQPEAVEESANAADKVDPFGLLDRMKIPCFLAENGGLTGPRRLIVSMAMPIVFFLVLHLALLLPPRIHKFIEGKTEIRITWGFILNIFLGLMNVFYIKLLVVSLSVVAFYDHPPHPTTGEVETSLIAFPNVLFHQDPANELVEKGLVEGREMWSQMLGGSIFALLFYVLGYEIIIGLIAASAPYHYGHPDIKWRKFFRETTKFAVLKYRPDRWWWCCAVVGRNFLVAITTVVWRYAHWQLMWLSLVLASYLAGQFFAWPWKWTSGNWMDATCTVVLLIYFTGSAFFILPEPDQTTHENILFWTGVVISCCMWAPLLLFFAMGFSTVSKTVGRVRHLGGKLQLGYEFIQVMGLAVQQPMHKINRFMLTLTEADRITLQGAMDIFLSEMFQFQPGNSLAGQNYYRRLVTPSRKRLIQSIIRSDESGLQNVEFEDYTPADVVSAMARKGQTSVSASSVMEVLASKATSVKFKPAQYQCLSDKAARRNFAQLLMFPQGTSKWLGKQGTYEARQDSMLLSEFRKRVIEAVQNAPSTPGSSNSRRSLAATELYVASLLNLGGELDDKGGLTISKEQFSQLFRASMPEHVDVQEDQLERIFSFLDIDDDEVLKQTDVVVALESLKGGWHQDLQEVHALAKQAGNKWKQSCLKRPQAKEQPKEKPPQQSMGEAIKATILPIFTTATESPSLPSAIADDEH